MTSHKITRLISKALMTIATAVAFVIAMFYAAQGGTGAATIAAGGLTMFSSFTAFKAWLAAIPYYIYVFISLGLLLLAILTTCIAIFKKGKIKRNDVSLLMMVGDADEEVDATVFKEHFAVVVVAKPSSMLPVSDKVIEPLFPMDDGTNVVASPAEVPEHIEKKIIVGDEELDADLNKHGVTEIEEEVFIQAAEPLPVATKPIVQEVAKQEQEVAKQEQEEIILANSQEEDIIAQDIESFVAEDFDGQYADTQSQFEAVQDEVLSDTTDNVEPLTASDDYYDNAAVADELPEIITMSDTDFVEDVEDHYFDERVYTDDAATVITDIDVMPIISASNEPTEVDVETSAEEDDVPPAEFDCVEWNEPATAVDMSYDTESTVDCEVFDESIVASQSPVESIIGEEQEEVLFDMDELEGDVQSAELDSLEQTESAQADILEDYYQEEIIENNDDTEVEIIDESDYQSETSLDDTEEATSTVSDMIVDDAILMVIPHGSKKANLDDQAHAIVSEDVAVQEAIDMTIDGTTVVDADGDGIVDEVLVDKDILKMRYKTVDMDKRIRRANDDTKAFYSEIKNCLLSYSGVKSRMSKKFDTYTIGRFILAKVAIRGNIINLYLALPGERVDEKYFAENVGNSETYGKTPTLHKVKSRRGCKYGLDLIIELMKELNMVEDTSYEQVNFAEQYPPENIDEKKAEISHLFRSSVSVDELDDLTDEQALELIDIIKKKEYTINKFNPINKYVVFLDDIAVLYNSGDTVTIGDLIAKEAIPNEPNIYLEVRARGVIDKKLSIEAHSFDIQAVKMIILTDGYVVQYK